MSGKQFESESNLEIRSVRFGTFLHDDSISVQDIEQDSLACSKPFVGGVATIFN